MTHKVLRAMMITMECFISSFKMEPLYEKHSNSHLIKEYSARQNYLEIGEPCLDLVHTHQQTYLMEFKTTIQLKRTK